MCKKCPYREEIETSEGIAYGCSLLSINRMPSWEELLSVGCRMKERLLIDFDMHGPFNAPSEREAIAKF